MDDEKRGVLLVITYFACTMIFIMMTIFFVQNHPWFFALCVFVFVCLFVLSIAFVMRYVTKAIYQDIGQYGTISRDLIGRPRLYSPMAVAEPKLTSGRAVQEIKLRAPQLGELISQGLLFQHDEEGVKMLMGFRADLSPRYEPWPGVIAITGQQNVGKSVTMTMLVVSALLQGAHIVVCDTHKTKPRSISRKLAPLEGLVTFAHTEAEVLRETEKFSDELEARKSGKAPYPYILFYDEFNSLAKARNEELRKMIPSVVEEGGREGHGFEMHIVAAIHDLSNSGIGDANIRAFFNWVFCHRMESIQSKFIEAFNTRQNRKIIAGLSAGHTVVRDVYNEVEFLMIPEGNTKDVLAARQLVQKALPTERETPPEIAIYRDTQKLISQPETARFTEPLPQAETPAFTPQLSLPAPHELPDFSTYEGRKEGVRRMIGKYNKKEIIKIIWGANPGGTKEWQEASSEFDHIKDELIKQAISSPR